MSRSAAFTLTQSGDRRSRGLGRELLNATHDREIRSAHRDAEHDQQELRQGHRALDCGRAALRVEIFQNLLCVFRECIWVHNF